jgi:uncharacterized protein
MPDHLDALAGLTLIFVAAGMVKGVIGLGLPTVAMAFLTLTMPPADAAAILVLPSFVTNVWQLAGPQLARLLRRLWPMQLASALATVATAHWLGAVSSAGAVAGLGAALMLYALTGLAPPVRLELPAPLEPWLGPVVGAATGTVTAMTGVFVIPAVPYLQALRLSPDDLVQALGISFTVSTIALAISLAGEGQFGWPNAAASALALAAAFAGMILGTMLRARMAPATFRRWFFIGLLLLGAHLLLRGLF